MLGHTLYRFLVPQSLLVFSVAVAMLMDPSQNIPQTVLRYLQDPLTIQSGVFVLLVGGSLPFALGFIIASMTATLFRLTACMSGRAKGFSTSWRKESQKELEKIYKFRDFRTESEQVEKCIFAELGSKAPTEWMQRRWEYCILGSNTCVGLALALAVVFVLGVQPGWPWYAGVTVICSMLAFNSRETWKEVMDMDNFLARNFQTLCRGQGGQTQATGIIQPAHEGDGK